jgi:hypothetical protein
MKTLKLDANYKPIEFISFKNMIKLWANDKIEILSFWDGIPLTKDVDYPAIVRLKNYIRTKEIGVKFSFRAIFKRDNYMCQYTGKKLSGSQLTIDHIVPKKLGGKSTWTNCCTASLEINALKSCRPLSETGLTLLRKPTTPKNPMFLEYKTIDIKHKDWEPYFPDIS